jgi:hypothetical protein
MRYRVKYPFRDEMRYGIVSPEGSPEAKKAKPSGMLLVADAVLPFTAEVSERDVVDIPLESRQLPRFNHQTQEWEGGDEYDQFVRAEHKRHEEIDAALPPGVHVGRLFQIGVADGLAYYVVTQLNGRRVTVEWRGFCPDRYTDHFFGWCRTCALKDVEDYVNRQQAQKDFWRSLADKEEAFLQAQPVGTILHQYDSASAFTRYEVVELENGKKGTKVIALVGDWNQRNLPTRDRLGEVHVPFAAKRVLDGEVLERLPHTTIWESPDFGWKDRKRSDHVIEDPRGKPPLDLSVPPITDNEREAARLWKLCDEIEEARRGRGECGDVTDPKTPRASLRRAYELLSAEFADDERR